MKARLLPSLLLLVPLAQIVMAIPLTPASWGTAEYRYDALFATVVAAGLGFRLSLLQRLSYYFWAALGCLVYLRRRATFRRALDLRDSPEGIPTGKDTPCESAPEAGVDAEKVVRGPILS